MNSFRSWNNHLNYKQVKIFPQVVGESVVMMKIAAVVVGLVVGVSAYAGSNRGRDVFQLCISCHGAEGHGNLLVEAPSIAGLPAWYVAAQLDKFRSGLRGKHADDDAGNRMRPLAMTIEPEDVKAVADYVATLPSAKPAPTITGGNGEKGKAAFNTCVTCHGAKGEGNEALHAPPLNMANDWYLLRQLHNFRKKVRAYDPTDAFGAAMAAQANAIADEKVLKNLVAYIASIDPSAPASTQGVATSIKVADLPNWVKGSPELVAKGKDIFTTNCATCHGATGNGDGAGGAALKPKPRNFHDAAAAWTHGNSAWSIYYTLANGSPGTGMAAYKTLSPEDRWALVHYVMSLSDGARVGKADAKGEAAAKEEIASAGSAPSETVSIEFAMQRIAE